MKSRHFILTGLCLAGALLTGSAMARGQDDVRWSVTVGSGSSGYHHPLPVYVQPAYAAPRYRGHYQQPTRWDRDGDGLHNRYDRVYNPRWDRDGDGVPNRHDRTYNPRWDRDGDGVPNRHDRHPHRADHWGR
ncbi:hypothetical protein [Roseateles sp.]|uniref:hypothetical protein n=1 Tax=Roseateles sp. TaxID=1971397 RepID=UPI00286A79F7|nr:hypothetical protein [Roseateles sp.]